MIDTDWLKNCVNNFHKDALNNPRKMGSCQEVAGELQKALLKYGISSTSVCKLFEVWVEFKPKDGVEGKVLLYNEEEGCEMTQPPSIPHANEDVYHIIMDGVVGECGDPQNAGNSRVFYQHVVIVVNRIFVDANQRQFEHLRELYDINYYVPKDLIEKHFASCH